MIDNIEQKENLKNLISQILEDEENMKSFTFLLNRVENIRRPIDEIQHVLEDYLCITKGLPVKGKYRVHHMADRHILKCKEYIGFVDANKIEIIAKAVIEKTAISLPITIHDFKRRYKNNILRNDEWGTPYREFIKKYKEGDEIIEIVSPYWTWRQLCGSAGVVLTREGEHITGIRKSMN